MRFNLNLKKKFKRFCLLLTCLIVLIFQSNIPNLKAFTMDNYQGEIVIEELRLKVPSNVKEAWLHAEKKYWNHGYLLKMVFWEDNYFGIKKKKKL